MILGSEVFGIGYSNRDVAIIVWRKTMAIGWTLVSVFTGNLRFVVWTLYLVDYYYHSLELNDYILQYFPISGST